MRWRYHNSNISLLSCLCLEKEIRQYDIQGFLSSQNSKLKAQYPYLSCYELMRWRHHSSNISLLPCLCLEKEIRQYDILEFLSSQNSKLKHSIPTCHVENS